MASAAAEELRRRSSMGPTRQAARCARMRSRKNSGSVGFRSGRRCSNSRPRALYGSCLIGARSSPTVDRRSRGRFRVARPARTAPPAAIRAEADESDFAARARRCQSRISAAHGRRSGAGANSTRLFTCASTAVPSAPVPWLSSPRCCGNPTGTPACNCPIRTDASAPSGSMPNCSTSAKRGGFAKHRLCFERISTMSAVH